MGNTAIVKSAQEGLQDALIIEDIEQIRAYIAYSLGVLFADLSSTASKTELLASMQQVQSGDLPQLLVLGKAVLHRLQSVPD